MSTFANKSPSALYSANSRYKQKLLSGKAPTAEEQDAHLIMEQRKASRNSPSSPRFMTPTHSPSFTYTPPNSYASMNNSSPGFGISPISYNAPYNSMVSGVSNLSLSPVSPVSSPRTRGRAKSTGARSPRVLSPEARAKAVLNVTNARYVKKIKNGQQPTVEEVRAHEIVENNKLNSPRVTTPTRFVSAEEKKQGGIIRVANARYAKKIKNGQEPTQLEMDAHDIIETQKAERLSPVSSPRMSETYVSPVSAYTPSARSTYTPVNSPYTPMTTGSSVRAYNSVPTPRRDNIFASPMSAYNPRRLVL